MRNDNFLKSYLHLHLIVFIWGFTAILGKLITLNALPLVWYRMFFAAILITLYVYFSKTSVKLSRSVIIKLLLAGIIIALHWLTFFEAIKKSNISITLACLSTGAFFASILEPIFYKRKIIMYEVLFGIIVIIGLYIIFSVQGNYLYGILLALSCALLSAIFSMINGKFVKEYDPTVISFYEIIGGVLFLSCYLLFAGKFDAAFFNLTTSDLLWLFVLSSACTAYAFIASVGVMKFLSPYTVMLTINLEPVYGIILALIIFNDNEKMTSQFYIGAAIILITVILNGFFKFKKK